MLVGDFGGFVLIFALSDVLGAFKEGDGGDLKNEESGDKDKNKIDENDYALT